MGQPPFLNSIFHERDYIPAENKKIDEVHQKIHTPPCGHPSQEGI
jgi:hypothetical protein